MANITINDGTELYSFGGGGNVALINATVDKTKIGLEYQSQVDELNASILYRRGRTLYGFYVCGGRAQDFVAYVVKNGKLYKTKTEKNVSNHLEDFFNRLFDDGYADDCFDDDLPDSLLDDNDDDANYEPYPKDVTEIFSKGKTKFAFDNDVEFVLDWNWAYDNSRSGVNGVNLVLNDKKLGIRIVLDFENGKFTINRKNLAKYYSSKDDIDDDELERIDDLPLEIRDEIWRIYRNTKKKEKIELLC